MYPCIRRHDICSIGFWSYPVGRPTESTPKKWIQRSNFVLEVLARLMMAEREISCGWLVKIKPQQGHTKIITVTAEHAASHSKLRQHIMRLVEGSVCRLTSDDFLSFVDEDCVAKVVYVSRHIGKVHVQGYSQWYFPTMYVGEIDMFYDESLVRGSGRDAMSLPDLPRPICMSSSENCLMKLRRLKESMMIVYGSERFVRAIHLMSSALKALCHDQLLKTFHFVPITNVSGPANCGKTLACAMTLALLETPSLMMSRCTPSAMVDAADTFKNLVVVWDDPRDCSTSQMSSIVHEAFNCNVTSLISRGVRRYNSLLIVGTQERNLGMPYTATNTATFSRLSHIDMDIVDASPFANGHESKLQAVLKDMGGMLTFLIENTQFDEGEIDDIYDQMSRDCTHVIGRSIQIAAIDRYFTSQLAAFMDIELAAVNTYFDTDYKAFLENHCGKRDAVERFCADLKSVLLRRSDIPGVCFKEKVTVDLKQFGPTECFAVYTKEVLPYLQKNSTVPLSYTKEQLHSIVKQSGKYGEVSRNVAYKHPHHGTVVRRSLVIRHMYIM